MKTQSIDNGQPESKVESQELVRSIKTLSTVAETLADMAEDEVFRGPDGILHDEILCVLSDLEAVIKDLNTVKDQSRGVNR